MLDGYELIIVRTCLLPYLVLTKETTKIGPIGRTIKTRKNGAILVNIGRNLVRYKRALKRLPNIYIDPRRYEDGTLYLEFDLKDLVYIIIEPTKYLTKRRRRLVLYS